MGLRDKILDVFPIINQSFNLPEGRDGFKSVNEGTISKWAIKVSIYPKAEMGLRDFIARITYILSNCFNLPEGRDGFKRIISINELIIKYLFQSTRRQRWV